MPITIEHTEQGHVFDIVVTERCGQDYARVRIADYHTNICRIEKNGTVLYEVPLLDETVQEDARADRAAVGRQGADAGLSWMATRLEMMRRGRAFLAACR